MLLDLIHKQQIYYTSSQTVDYINLRMILVRLTSSTRYVNELLSIFNNSTVNKYKTVTINIVTVKIVLEPQQYKGKDWDVSQEAAGKELTKNVGAVHFSYQINRLTTTKVDSTYLG